MAKERTQRFQTAQEVEEALAKLNEKGGGWLRKAASNVPLVRASDPIARERRVGRKPSDSQLEVAPPGSPPPATNKPVSGDEAQLLRPVARVPTSDGESIVAANPPPLTPQASHRRAAEAAGTRRCRLQERNSRCRSRAPDKHGRVYGGPGRTLLGPSGEGSKPHQASPHHAGSPRHCRSCTAADRRRGVFSHQAFAPGGVER
jgi:hypothetical protein